MIHSSTELSSLPPRERLFFSGSLTLTDQELLALLIGTGHRGESVYQVARQLLREFGDPRALAEMHPTEVLRVTGLGAAKVARLFAALELGRRITRRRWERGTPFHSARQVFDHFQPLVRDLKREVFCALFLDARNRLIGEEEISCGSLVASIVHPREVFRPAIQRAAAAIVCVHNHPSGDPEYSAEDLAITERLFAVGELVGIGLLDHVIVGEHDYCSFVDSRLGPFRAAGDALPARST